MSKAESALSPCASEKCRRHLFRPSLELDDVGNSDSVARLRSEIKGVCRGMARDFALERVAGRISKQIRRIGFIDSKDLGSSAHEALAKRAEEKVQEIQSTVAHKATADKFRTEITLEEDRLMKSVGSANWKRLFRGRDVLRKFCATRAGNLRYETLRNVIVNEMARDGFRPTGMSKALQKILNS